MQIQIQCRICEYIRLVTEQKVIGTEKEFRFLALESSVQASFRSLPSWLSLNAETRFANVSFLSRQPLHWIYALVISCAHCIALMLYKTRLLSYEDSLTDDIIQRVENSAEAITFITSLFLRDNPYFLDVNPYISIQIFEAKPAWLSLIKSRPKSQVVITLSYEYKLSLLITALENIGIYFDLAKDQAKELKKMKLSRFALGTIS